MQGINPSDCLSPARLREVDQSVVGRRSTELNGIQWAIVGRESGTGARPILKKEWVTDLLALCQHYNTAFFFKQRGGVNNKATGRLLDGRTLRDEMSAATIQPLLIP